jgi:uncharacterized membrane protein
VIERLRLLIRRALYGLRGGFLVRPLAIALILGAIGALLSWFEESHPSIGDWVPRVLFLSHGDPQVAQVILAGIAGSIMTVVSIVFAILLMTLTLASMQFSPRIIVSFSRDQVTQWTLGIFLGTFLYCMAALPAAHALPHPFAPVITVIGAIGLAIVCVGLLLFFIHHISQAISVNQIVDRIAFETERAIDEVMPLARRPGSVEVGSQEDPQTWTAPILSDVSGYIRYVDLKQLLSIASEHHLRVRLVRRVGQFVPAGVPLLMANKAENITKENSAAFRAAFDFGPSRTLQQDIEFGVLQIVDIALKAISPAVNDPTTAISCVDQLSRLLIRFTARQMPDAILYDIQGVPRVNIQWIDCERLLDSAFEQIRMYSKGDVAVSLRLLRALGDIAGATADPALRRVLFDRGRRVVDGCAERIGADELKPLLIRLTALEKLDGMPGTKSALMEAKPKMPR